MITFPDHPAPGVSPHYVHIDTNQFIAAMKQEGFRVDSIRRDKTRQRDPLYARHVVRFEHETVTRERGRPDLRPQIIFMNSHNRTTRATVSLGVFRLVCSNGLVVGDIRQQAAVRHAGDAARELIARSAELARNTAPLFQQIERWERQELTAAQARAFAERAAILRWGERGAQYTPEQLLAARRSEDDSMTLWSVFNRVQENTTKGGLQVRTATGRLATTRPLTELNVDGRYNAELRRAAAELAGAR